MSDEELAAIYSALDDPKRIEALRLMPKLDNQSDIAEEISVDPGTVSRYVSDFEDAGLLVRKGVSGHELTGRGEKAISNELLEAPTVATTEPLDDYWPALAYATGNTLGKDGASISYSDIIQQHQENISGNDLSSLIKEAMDKNYLEKKARGIYEITSSGAKLVNKGFEFEEGELEYEENDWQDLIDRLKSEDSPIEYWPVFAYATCNSPGEDDGARISQEDIAEASSSASRSIFNLSMEAEEKGLIEKTGKGDWIITDKGAEMVQEGFQINEENIEYSEDDFEGLVKRLESKRQGIEDFWPALSYAYFEDSITQRDIEEASDLSQESLRDVFREAKRRGYIEQEGVHLQVTAVGAKLVNEGFSFEPRNTEYPENDWSDLIERIEEEKGEDKDPVSTREVKTVNADSIILNGGLIIPKSQNGGLPRVEEGDEIKVEGTGEKHQYGALEIATPVK